MNATILSEEDEQGITLVNGRRFMTNAKGDLVAVDNIKAQDLLEDEVVRNIHMYAVELSDQIARFKQHTLSDLGELDGVIEQEYGATPRGGRKGNRTYMSFDGLMKVTVQIQDSIAFGPQLQVAKGLIDDCLNEWSADSRPEIQSIITNAFDTDKEGEVSPTKIYPLLRLDIEDGRWKRAMDALRDAMRVVSSKQYVRFYVRDNIEEGWTAITIDLAKVK
ncbi:MAG: DUF3164 family protein [Ahrensia sp.]|nr:DUF3164 family protein [Ahrensia sp.]